MTAKTWRFTPHDTWFFRESRPHGVVGGSELSSLFPPPVRTLAGATRFLMGEAVGVDWGQFKHGRDEKGPGRTPLREVIGDSKGLGQLQLNGPWLARVKKDEAERLYPAPAFLFRKALPAADAKEPAEIERLVLGPPTRCDLGTVPLACFPEDRRGTLLDDTWLTGAGLERALAGGTPESGDVIDLRTLIDEEPRLGIARSNAQRTNLDGMLYQTRHVRPRALHVELDVTVPDPRLEQPQQLVRLGGEGRMAGVEVIDPAPALPAPPTLPEGGGTLALCLLTAADLGPVHSGNRRDAWVPPGLERRDGQFGTEWVGALRFHRPDGTPGRLPLTLTSAFLPNAGREGGWDLANNRPRPVRSLVPAGSVWLCRATTPEARHAAVKALHGAFVGNDHQLGRGQLAVGFWPERS